MRMYKMNMEKIGFELMTHPMFTIQLELDAHTEAFAKVMDAYEFKALEEEDPDVFTALVDYAGEECRVSVCRDEPDQVQVEVFGEVDIDWISELVEELESIGC